MLALGFGLGRGGIVAASEARAVNRVSFLVLQPALILPLMVGADLSEFQPAPLAGYALSEAAMFAAAFAVARHVFGRELREAWLLGMAAMFVNSLLYVWPISFLIYGSEAALPITAIVIWDTAFFFAFFILSMEILSGSGDTKATLRRIAANPVLIAIVLGGAVNLAGLALPVPVANALGFAGPAAAPMTLFALGVILSGTPVRPTPTVAGMAALKLGAFPALVFGVTALIAPGSDWSPLMVLTAAGPSGAMPFALALLYGVRTDTIAPVIVWTSILSLISLATLA
nr:AEC family transporter [Palleronia pontilimi]